MITGYVGYSGGIPTAVRPSDPALWELSLSHPILL